MAFQAKKQGTQPKPVETRDKVSRVSDIFSDSYGIIYNTIRVEAILTPVKQEN